MCLCYSIVWKTFNYLILYKVWCKFKCSGQSIHISWIVWAKRIQEGGGRITFNTIIMLKLTCFKRFINWRENEGQLCEAKLTETDNITVCMHDHVTATMWQRPCDSDHVTAAILKGRTMELRKCLDGQENGHEINL